MQGFIKHSKELGFSSQGNEKPKVSWEIDLIFKTLIWLFCGEWISVDKSGNRDVTGVCYRVTSGKQQRLGLGWLPRMLDRLLAGLGVGQASQR